MINVVRIEPMIKFDSEDGIVARQF
jgi:hypothetical protein